MVVAKRKKQIGCKDRRTFTPLAIDNLNELKIRACGSAYVLPNRRTSKTQHMGKDTLNRATAKLFGIEPRKKKQPQNIMGDIEYFTVHNL